LEVVESGGTHLRWGAAGYCAWTMEESFGVNDAYPKFRTCVEAPKQDELEGKYFEHWPPERHGETVHYRVWITNHPQNASNEVTIIWP
jgi:hypothetical protein